MSGPQADDVTVRAFAPSDLDAVLALREEVFPGLDLPRERRRWQWEFDENPNRIAGLPDAWVLEHQGRVVGNYGLLPGRASADGEVISAVGGIDFAVDPSLQGRGLGHLIAQRFMAADLCDLAYITSPTPATCHLMAKYGGTVIVGAEEPSLWVFPLKSDRSPPSIDQAVTLDTVRDFDVRFDQLNDALRRGIRLLTMRDARYLNWRYRDYPFGAPTAIEARVGGELRGFAVFQHEPNLRQGNILELFLAPEDREVAQALLAAMIAEARQADADELYILNRIPAVQATLGASGFHRVDGHPLQFVCRPPAGGPAPRDWYLTTGDGDILFGVGDLPAS